jgi:C1A family cysteine protease
MPAHLLKRHYGGWLAQRPDHRDHEFLPSVPRQAIPPELELEIAGIPVLDQGQQGSCTGHGSAGIVMFDQKKQGEPVVVPSREFIYWNARNIEGTPDQDSGAQVRDVVKVIAGMGAPPDSDFPYNDQVYSVRPPAQAYTDALRQEALVYEAVRYPHLNQALASGFPFVFGFTVYESFESAQVEQTGIVPIPQPGEQVLGGHCVWCWGYNTRYSGQTGRIPPRHKACRNSWNSAWGDYGDFYLPQAYWDMGLCSDHWVIRRIGAK